MILNQVWAPEFKEEKLHSENNTNGGEDQVPVVGWGHGTGQPHPYAPVPLHPPVPPGAPSSWFHL